MIETNGATHTQRRAQACFGRASGCERTDRDSHTTQPNGWMDAGWREWRNKPSEDRAKVSKRNSICSPSERMTGVGTWPEIVLIKVKHITNYIELKHVKWKNPCFGPLNSYHSHSRCSCLVYKSKHLKNYTSFNLPVKATRTTEKQMRIK